MRPSRIILLSVGLSVLASVLTTLALAPPGDRGGHAPRGGGDLPPAPQAGNARPSPGAPADLAELRETVRRLEEKVEAPPERHAEDALAVLIGIKQGERQLAIEDSFKELSALGNDVVPRIVAILKSGEDQDYGGGFSFGGNKMRGYPRLRTVLIDVLRQIGTPEAQRGLLEGLRGTDDPLDYRDLLLLYRTTSDEIMVNGISAMMPAILDAAGGTGDEMFLLVDYATSWIRQHDLEDTAPALEKIARESFAAGRPDRGAFTTLVALAPERAFTLIREQHAKLGDTVIQRSATGFRMGRAEIPLAQVARYCELILTLDMSDVTRGQVFQWLPDRLCTAFESAGARNADGRVLLEFLRKRLAVETSDYARRALTDHISKLEQALQQ